MSKIFVDTIEPKTANSAVLFPDKPAFRVVGPSSAQNGLNITSGYINITFWSTTLSEAFINDASTFNTSTGKYTVPITGVYHYDYYSRFANVASGYYAVWMQINGVHTDRTPFSVADPTAGSAYSTINNSGLLSLTAGDVLHWTHRADPDTSIDIPANTSGWSMYLVG